jgi:C-terminal processing protease CtpA/Prc
MVVTGFASPEAEKASGLFVGDVVTGLDGVPVIRLIEQWTPYYAVSNDAARMRDMARSLTRGACVDVSMDILRGGLERKIDVHRTEAKDSGRRTHDLPGETFRLLSKDIAYLKLSSVKSSDAARYVEQAAGTKGLIIDIRNYPSQFMVFALGQLLVDKDTPFARFTRGDPSTPGAFHWTQPLSLTPRAPHYAGKVVILTDETSQSQAEYTAMAFRSAPNAIVVGSTTAGADGNVSEFLLPGGHRTMISGIGVFYPDRRPTQRVGIIPDVESRPTIAGIRDGRDEVLEQGLRQILGNAVSAEEIEKMARH